MEGLDSQKLFDKWKGCEAAIWHFEISHGRLIIGLYQESVKGCLEISCLDAEFICGFTRWSDCNLKIEKADYHTNYNIPICFVISDEKAKFEVHCGAIKAIELEDIYGLSGNASDSRFARE